MYQTGMVLYRRNRIAGGTYFFTLTLQNRSSDLLVRYIDDLREAFRHTRKERPFKIDASVILPEHLHAILTLPKSDSDYPTRWKSIKSLFTRQLVNKGLLLGHNEKGEYNLWRRRYWEHTIRDDRDMMRHIDYIHFNPVKHGLVKQVCDWPYSSFHRYVQHGILSNSWAGECDDEDGSSYGE